MSGARYDRCRRAHAADATIVGDLENCASETNGMSNPTNRCQSASERRTVEAIAEFSERSSRARIANTSQSDSMNAASEFDHRPVFEG
jgi:hypothetical protein